MDQFKFNRYIPIAKVDDDQRMVYGWASTPDLDSDGEVVELLALEQALPEYMKFPTLREMHQPKVAGRTKNAEIRNSKGNKGLYIGAKILSSDAWDMVKGGGYSGFSIGGNVTLRVGNKIKGLELVEISLVDVPANKGAKIEVWKNKKLTKDTPEVSMALEKRIASLEKMDFGENKVGNILGKGVIDTMKTKAKELKKGDEAEEKDQTAADETASDKTKTEAKDETATEEKEEVVVTETETADEAEEEKEAADESTDLKKMQEVDKQLSKLAPSETAEKLSLAKTVSAMAGNITKVVSVLQKLEERIAILEKTPAATKSKAAFVFKSEGDKPKDKEAQPTGELGIKKARLAELDTKFNELGPNQFAKMGFSMEASRLQNEVEALEHTAQK